MKNTKLTYSNYDKGTGISYVIIQTPKGVFSGTSTLREIDLDIESSFLGCQKAEQKAYIKYLSALINDKSIEVKVFEDFYKNLKTSHRFKEDSYMAKRIRKQIHELQQKKNTLLKEREKRRELVKETESFRGIQKKIREKYQK